MCLTVEIDEKQFPHAHSFFERLNDCNIRYVNSKENLCYKIEIDTEKSLKIVSNTLADIIKHTYLTKYAENIIKTDYFAVSICDREGIVDSVMEYTDICEISDLIFEYAKANPHIHLGGFVMFRMKDFMRSFEDEIDFAVDEYVEQQRHKDFVKFLKFFISIQESEVEKINLILLNNYKYYLLDGNGKPISKNLLDSTHCEISNLEDNSAYLLINDLVALSPRHIVIHCGADDLKGEIPSLVKEIFDTRVSTCQNCLLCNRQKHH